LEVYLKVVIDIDNKQLSIDDNFPLHLLKSIINNLSSSIIKDEKWVISQEEKELIEVKKHFAYYENNG
jgi:hypothetical protein